MTSRHIALGSDHAGFALKEILRTELESQGIRVTDVGAESVDSVDYPDYAAHVARLVSKKEVPEGILVCGTGIGMSITANRFPGVRAAVAVTPEMAKLARAHNNANVLCLGSRLIDEKAARLIMKVFLSEPFEGGRHVRRVEKIDSYGLKAPERKRKCC